MSERYESMLRCAAVVCKVTVRKIGLGKRNLGALAGVAVSTRPLRLPLPKVADRRQCAPGQPDISHHVQENSQNLVKNQGAASPAEVLMAVLVVRVSYENHPGLRWEAFAQQHLLSPTV